MSERAKSDYSVLFYCDDQFEAEIHNDAGEITGYYLNDNHHTGLSDRPTQMSFSLMDTVTFPPVYEDRRDDKTEQRQAFGHHAHLASLDDVTEVVRYWNETDPHRIASRERIMAEFASGKYPDIRHQSFSEIINSLQVFRFFNDPEAMLQVLDAALDGGIVLEENIYYVEILQAIRDATAEGRLTLIPAREKSETYGDFMTRYNEYIFSYDPASTSLPL